MTRYLVPFGLILFAALSRVLPHPVNVAPIAALALFGAVYLEKKHAFLIPLIALLLSDYVIGFYSGMIWVYTSFAAISCIGLWLRNHRGTVQTIGASLTSSVLFFVVTNFGVWVSSTLYSQSFSGLVQCYVAAIPFFRNTLIGDGVYVTTLFGIFETIRHFVPSVKMQPTK